MNTNLARESVALDDLTPHPRNYRSHPDDQIAHLAASIEQFGFFRNIVIARDNTILAGHGIVEAARALGLDEVPAVRLNLDADSPEALKVLAVDNEVARFAEIDDRALTELLREVSAAAEHSLLGTGYDEMTLAGLALVTRTVEEIADFDAAAEWVGMPDFAPAEKVWRVIVICPSEAERTEFIERAGLTGHVSKAKAVTEALTVRWPIGSTPENALGNDKPAWVLDEEHDE